MDPDPARHRRRPGPGAVPGADRGGALRRAFVTTVDRRLRRFCPLRPAFPTGGGGAHHRGPGGNRHTPGPANRLGHGAAPVMYSGLEYSDSAVQAIRATLVLWALAGQLDVPGRPLLHPGPEQVSQSTGTGSSPTRISAGPPGATASRSTPPTAASSTPTSFPEPSWRKPYPIRLLISLGASIITSWPQSAVWRKTLGALDFPGLHRPPAHRRCGLCRHRPAGDHLLRDRILHGLRSPFPDPGAGDRTGGRGPKRLLHPGGAGSPAGLRPSLPPERGGASAPGS